MFLLYVDESGDVGLAKGASRFFVLSGLVIHELRWLPTLQAVTAFRRQLRDKFTLKLREEIHASVMMHSPGALARISKPHRLQILREVVAFEAGMADVSLLHVVVDKQNKTAPYDVFEKSWSALIQRFHNTISRKNFPGPQNADERGLLITDATDGEKLQRLTRRMRHFNPIPSQFGIGYRQIPLDLLVEDPIPRDSRHSFLLQLCDVNAYLLTQKLTPNKFFRKRSAANLFTKLDPVLCKVAAPRDPLGLVRL